MASIFTKIINKEIPAEIVFEDDLVIAINDISPKAPIHVLIIPKKEISTINDFEVEDESLIGHIVLTAKRIAKLKGVAEDGYRLIFNCNEWGGQSVYHVHCHLIAGAKLGWNPA
jgi:histidine triad (HIT) family protein